MQDTYIRLENMNIVKPITTVLNEVQPPLSPMVTGLFGVNRFKVEPHLLRPRPINVVPPK